MTSSEEHTTRKSEIWNRHPVPDDAWDEFRRQMPVVTRWTYLDHAAVSPLPGPSQAAITQWALDAATNGDTSWMTWSQQVEGLRPLFADLLGANEDEIALVHNTTEGVNIVADGYPWRSGDNIVTLAEEFPTNQYAWMHLASRGVETRRVPMVDGRVDLNRLAEVCDGRTRLVAVSWVSYWSGWRNDVDQLVELAHSVGAQLFLDAIQALGVSPLDVGCTGVDFLAADGHKWLLGPEGSGVFYCRREHLDWLRPMGIGWNSVRHAYDFNRIELDLKRSASRYEGGSQNMVGSIGLLESLKLLARFGPAAIQTRIAEVTDLACRRLTQLGATVRSDRSPEHSSGIVLFDLPGGTRRRFGRRVWRGGWC